MAAPRHEPSHPETSDHPEHSDTEAHPDAPNDQLPTRTVREYKGTGIMWGAIGLVLLLVGFIIVVLQNGDNVEFNFLWITVTTPLSLVIAVTTAVSLAVGELIGFVWRRRRRSDLQRREELRRLREKTR